MARIVRFTFLCSQHERSMISNLAEHLHRSQSDSIRFLINAAVRELTLENRHENREASSKEAEKSEYKT